MRIDRYPPYKTYRDFWEWLFDGWHPVFVLALMFSYLFYLVTTTEA